MIALNPQAFSSYLAGTTRTLPNVREQSAGGNVVSAGSDSALEALINAILRPNL